MGVGVAILGGAAIGGLGSYLASRQQSGAIDDASDAQMNSAYLDYLMQQDVLAQQRSMYDTSRQDYLSMYEQSREDIAPWLQAGLDELSIQQRLLQPRYEQMLKELELQGMTTEQAMNELALREPAFRKEMEMRDRSLKDLERTTEEYEDLAKRPINFRQYEKDPYYNFLQEQGIDTINKGASASGSLDTGARLKDLATFGQGLASQGYRDYVNQRQQQLGNIGNVANRYALNANMVPLSSTGTIPLGNNSGGSSGSSIPNLLANLNQNYAGNLGNLNTNMSNNYANYGTNMSNIYGNQANAQVGQYIGNANAMTGLYNNLSNIGSNAVNQYLYALGSGMF